MRMKKIFIILVGLSVAGLLHAQTDDTLTNKSIIKMTRAKLADELIIDVIESSDINFDLSPDAIINLKSENVTAAVIEAMKKKAGPPKAPITSNPPLPEKEKPQNRTEPVSAPAAAVAVPAPKVAEPETAPQETVKQTPVPVKTQYPPQPLTIAAKAGTETVEPAVTIEALKYLVPLKTLVGFHEKEFRELTNYIIQWDKQILDQTAEINRINSQMQLIEAEMRGKKNADANKYSGGILALIMKQTVYRQRYKQAKNNLIAVGDVIAKKFDYIGKETNRALGSQYDESRQRVKSSAASQATAAATVAMTFPRLSIISNTTKYLVPLTEMLSWHQNKINEIQLLVKKTNAKVVEVSAKDAQLSKQLELIDGKLEEYGAKPKSFKSEIAALNKQNKAIEKQRKTLAKQMENDSNELADYLKQSLAESQDSVKQRLEDIIQNMTYMFQEQLTY
jgi:hypothetical protein